VAAEHGSWLNWVYHINIAGHRLNPEIFPPHVPVAILVALALCVLGYLGTRKRQRIPGGFQNAVEMAVEGLERLLTAQVGPGTARFVPFLTALFLFILCMNLVGLIPGFVSPTANLNTTFALGLIVFFTVQGYGIVANGPLGYVKHFVGDLRGVPWLMLPMLVAILFPLHIIEELVKPLTLSVRLYGNISGEDTVLAQFNQMSEQLPRIVGVPIPIGLPIMGLALFTSAVQALVFTALSAVYLSLFEPHEEAY
jgi:F-type H+-transporting ATPase subunit a